ncbi:PREDICTED: pectinesterase-like isoform X1 [Populus euphratica]|uniref:Pectinesterase n=1 Tax=Populus euphratica TaxID=75702 RepID=A0AAJ6V0P6_POPEU|nr:PREDICTED: pectinesterase-like isoform X1 [Populus euphratica]
MTEANQYNTSISKKKKKLIQAIFASFLLVATIIAILTGVSPQKTATQNDAADHAKLIKSTSSKNDFLLQVNRSIDAAQSNMVALSNKLATSKKLDVRQKTAINDCWKNNDRVVADLKKVFEDVKVDTKNKSPQPKADQDLNTKFASCMTGVNSCLDGFSHSKRDKKVREALSGIVDVKGKCQKALEMVTSKPTADMAIWLKNTNRKLKEDSDSYGGGAEWLSVTDRRLFQLSSLTPDVVVAADGSGTYKTVSAAVAAAPKYSSKRYIIRIKAGVYRENVEVPKEKSNIMFLGDGRKTTIITGSRNVVGGSTTYHSATVAVEGQGFLARDITFQNTAGPSKYQAVALRVESDFAAFYKCGMLGYQNTLYVHSNRQFFRNCFIAGTIDFIFGNAAAVFQDCDIRARRPNPGQTITITAQGRSDPTQNTGIVIQKCRIGVTSDLHPVRSNFSAYLGRPWKEYARTVIMQSSISDVIHPAGWNGLKGRFALSTLSFAEYENSGAGAGTSKRVTWEGYKMITSATEAQSFTPRNFIAGSSWLKSTTFPFSLDL